MLKHIRAKILFFVGCMLCLFCNGQQHHATSHNVLYVNSYALGYSWTDSVVTGIQKEMAKNMDVQIFVEFLDAKRFGQVHFESIFRFLQRKYQNIKFDVIITSDNDALDFIIKYGDQLAPDVPVVFCGINNIRDYSFPNNRYYGILDGVDFKTEINMIVKIMPGIRKLYFITDSSTTSLLNLRQIRSLEKEYTGRLEFVYLHNYTLDSLKLAVQNFEPGNAIALINYYNEPHGLPLPVESVYKELVDLSPVPVFIDFEALLGYGIAGGVMIKGSDYGRQAAGLALQIIRQSDYIPEKHMILPEETYFFDYDVLRKYGISVKNLPSNATTINLPQKKIRNHSGYIFTLVLVVFLLTAIILLLYFSARKRKKAEKLLSQKMAELQEKNQKLEKSQSRLTEMNNRLEEANNHLASASEALFQAKQKSEESEKLKSAFLANISHQIRTPLNAIIGFSTLINEYQITEKEKADYLKIISSSSDQLLGIIDDILDLSKIESGQLQIRIETFSLQELLIELTDTFRQVAQTKQIDLKISIPDSSGDLTMMTDRSRLKQILGNLLSNAVKFTRKGSVEIGFNLDIPKEIVLYVKDTGIGIRPDDLKKIFSRFWKADFQEGKMSTGAGVGLAICKKLADALGAKIWVESDSVSGTTFYIAFQEYMFKKRDESGLNTGTNHLSLNGYCIAIAEDEKDNMYLITRMLRDLDVKIIQFQTGKEIVDFFKEGESMKIDLILMDIKMPVMDGITAAQVIREIKPGIPIIAQTAFALYDETDKHLLSVFDDYLFKPIKPMLLINKIKKILAPAPKW